MKKIFLVLFLLATIAPNVSANFFEEKQEATVTKYSDKEIIFKITSGENTGATVSATITEHKPNRRVYRDEYIKAHLNRATLANGTQVTLDQEMKLRPRRFLNPQMIGIGTIATAGGVLGITIDFLTLGLPIVRGGLAVWDAGYEIYDKPEGASTWKAGAKGFMDGALFPFPQLFMRARKLGLDEGVKLVIYSADADETVYVTVPRNSTKIENHR